MCTPGPGGGGGGRRSRRGGGYISVPACSVDSRPTVWPFVCSLSLVSSLGPIYNQHRLHPVIYPDDARPNFLTPRQASPLFTTNKESTDNRLSQATPCIPASTVYPKQATGWIHRRPSSSPSPSLFQDADHQRDSGRFHAANDGEDQHKHCDAHPVPHRGADQAQGGDGRLYVWSPSSSTRRV